MDIVCHWAWEWPEYSTSAVEIVLEGISGAKNERQAHPYFGALRRLCEVPDSLQQRRILALLWTGVAGPSGNMDGAMEYMRKMPSVHLTVVFLSMLLQMCMESPVIAKAMAAERKRWIWVDKFLNGYARVQAVKDMQGSVEKVLKFLEENHGACLVASKLLLLLLLSVWWEVLTGCACCACCGCCRPCVQAHT